MNLEQLEDLGVALAEPLQQNPDEHHRRLFLDFLLKRGSAVKRQAIMVTSFYEEEVAALRNAGVSVQVVEARFLKPMNVSDTASPGDAR